MSALERIGVWRDKTFKTYFVEGTLAFPTVSNRLLWSGLIVITRTNPPDLNSYVVPAPGVRLKLADITDTLPVWTLMFDINDHGDILGVGGDAYFVGGHTFVLKRVDGDSRSRSKRRIYSVRNNSARHNDGNVPGNFRHP